MQYWDLTSLEVEPHHPRILDSVIGQSRSIAITLPAGEALQEHQVHERAHLLIVDGEVELDAPEGVVLGRAGTFVVFNPGEPREVRAAADTRLLLILAPWPGPGHPGARH